MSETLEGILLLGFALGLVFANYYLIYKTIIKPKRKKDRKIESPNQFPYSGHSIGGKNNG